MQGVVVLAWVYFAAALVAAGIAFKDGSSLLFGAALTSVLGGILLLAVDRALVRLTEIRDALRGPQDLTEDVTPKSDAPKGGFMRQYEESELDRRLEEARVKNWR